MTKLIRSLKLVEKIILNQDFFILNLSSSEPLPLILPGQFVHARIDNSKKLFYDVLFRFMTLIMIRIP